MRLYPVFAFILISTKQYTQTIYVDSSCKSTFLGTQYGFSNTIMNSAFESLLETSFRMALQKAENLTTPGAGSVSSAVMIVQCRLFRMFKTALGTMKHSSAIVNPLLDSDHGLQNKTNATRFVRNCWISYAYIRLNFNEDRQ